MLSRWHSKYRTELRLLHCYQLPVRPGVSLSSGGTARSSSGRISSNSSGPGEISPAGMFRSCLRGSDSGGVLGTVPLVASIVIFSASYSWGLGCIWIVARMQRRNYLRHAQPGQEQQREQKPYEGKSEESEPLHKREVQREGCRYSYGNGLSVSFGNA